MIKMTIHHGEEVQQRDLPCDFLSLRMSLYQMNLMLAPNEVSVRDVQAEFTSTDPIGQKLISLIRPGDLLSDVDVAIHQLKAAPQAIQEAMRQRLLDGTFETIEDIHMDDQEVQRRSQVTAELSRMCDTGHYTDEQLLTIILDNARKQYELCPENQGSKATAVCLAYSDAQLSEELDTELFLKTVSNILLKPDGSIQLRLISGKTI